MDHSTDPRHSVVMTDSRRVDLIQTLLKTIPTMELIEQIQWVKKMQQLGVRYTLQTNGILINLKTLTDQQLIQLQPPT